MTTGPLSLPTGPLALPASTSGLGGDFWKLWLAQAASQMGDRIHQVALMWWALNVTNSLALTGLVMIATTLPTVLLGPVGGALADRWDRRTLMIGADAARAVVVMAMAAMAYFGQLTFPVVLAASFLLACLTAFFTPANMAMVPALVDKQHLLRANSFMETTAHSAGVLGPAVGGAIVAAIGAPAAFGANGASFVLSGLAIASLAWRPAPPAGGAAEPFAESMKAGFRLLRAQPTIAGLLACFACLNFFSVSILLFLPHFAKDVFAVGAGGLGLLEAAVAVGMLLAALGWARMGQVKRRFQVFFGATAAIAATYVAMGLAPHFGAFLFLLALTGALFGSINVVVMAFFQERVPAAEMGRFMGLLMSVVFALMPLSYGVFGLLGGLVAPQWLLVANGAAIALVAAAMWKVPGLRGA